MDDNIANILILAIAIVSVVALVASIAWFRIRLRQAAGEGSAARRIERHPDESERLQGQVARFRERLEVLERIATDPAVRTADEIELLR